MYRILIVEDDRGIAGAIKAQAEMWNLEAVCAENFRDVLGEFARVQPHLVLLDITLPFFNGYHWCSEIRRLSNVPIIFISSAADNMNIVMAMSMGADDFIAKPFDGSVLMAKVQALLRRSYDFAAASPLRDHAERGHDEKGDTKQHKLPASDGVLPAAHLRGAASGLCLPLYP